MHMQTADAMLVFTNTYLIISLYIYIYIFIHSIYIYIYIYLFIQRMYNIFIFKAVLTAMAHAVGRCFMHPWGFGFKLNVSPPVTSRGCFRGVCHLRVSSS